MTTEHIIENHRRLIYKLINHHLFQKGDLHDVYQEVCLTIQTKYVSKIHHQNSQTDQNAGSVEKKPQWRIKVSPEAIQIIQNNRHSKFERKNNDK